MFDKVFGHFQDGNDLALVGINVRFLLCDLLSYFQRLGVVRDNLTVDAVFQWRNNTAAIGVVLRIGRKNKLDFQRQPQLESTDLNITFLQDVEQGNLNAGLQVGQFVDDENTAVGAGD